MTTKYAVIVGPATIENPLTDDLVAFGYRARVEKGTIQSYYPGSGPRLWRPTARWAKAAGDAWIRREHAREARANRRERKASRVTGYDEETT